MKKLFLENVDILEALEGKIKGQIGEYTFSIVYWNPSTLTLEIIRRTKRVRIYLTEPLLGKKIVRILLKGDKRSEMLWRVLRLLRNLSDSNKEWRLQDFLYYRDYDAVLKSVWYSITIGKYISKLRREKVRDVKFLIKNKEVSPDNIWAKKILNIESYVTLQKIFTNKWDNR